MTYLGASIGEVYFTSSLGSDSDFYYTMQDIQADDRLYKLKTSSSRDYLFKSPQDNLLILEFWSPKGRDLQRAELSVSVYRISQTVTISRG
ncbi:hypothetical protein J6590_028555 [Homalodisca vitripennis]|nr:hypothetical protein J6590_028555 [Homalodisca vitripennis]